MSNGLAIAGVTAVLQRLITDGLMKDFKPESVGTFNVTALPPSRVLSASNGADADQLNLFLYQVTPNAGWRNVALPSRGEDGERRSNPPLALDLHYVLTAYGAQLLNAEILLGCAMQALHELPYLTRDAVRTALAGTPAGTPLDTMLKALGTSGLADQIEQIKITPQALNAEEISKLWTAFQAPYRPTAGYLATVVLIESKRAVKPSLPVRERILKVISLQRPAIDTIESIAGPDEPIAASSTIVLEGQQLRGETTSVIVSGTKITPALDKIADTRIEVDLPPTLRAGLQGVQVVQEVDLGKPPVAHRGVESNVSAFVLHPQIIVPSTATGSVAIDFNPKVGRSQRVTLLLSEPEPAPAPPARSFNITAPPDNGIASPNQETGTIVFKLDGVDVGTTYFVRALVDGAESALEFTGGAFSGPTLKVT